VSSKSKKLTVAGDRLHDVAYYHEPYWFEGAIDWLKSLLLFFDGVAVLVPDEMRDVPLLTDPVLAQPLADQGLLVRLSPEELVDQTAAEAIADLLRTMLDAAEFDDLDRTTHFAELSNSRLGGGPDVQIEKPILDELVARGLARPSVDNFSVPLHPVVRRFILLSLPQILRERAEQLGYALNPATPYPREVRALLKHLDREPFPTRGHLVAADLEQVTLDLSSVPLDEVLDFRQSHGAAHRAYARSLRKFIRELSPLDASQRAEALMDRREELADAADELRRTARKAWNRPLATFGLGIAGSAVSLGTGSPIPAGISAGQALLGFKRSAEPGSAYSYLFQAQQQLSR
jgi:hypothetical protein